MGAYFRPLVQVGPGCPANAHQLAGGWGWFTQAEVLSRTDAARVISAAELPDAVLTRLTAARAAIAGLTLGQPRVMGILNTTPDSFSDGGLHAAQSDAVAGALAMQSAGADMIDIGGESTRPGASFVEVAEETGRTAPIIAALRAEGLRCPISIDTRKAPVAQAAVEAGADVVNDVSGFTFDPALAPFCAQHDLPVCVMHAQGDPATMQNDPQYDDVLLDVYDYLDGRIDALVAQGLRRDRIVVDPGIGFGKTLDHNLTLLSRLGLFHALGVPILLGASRKKFIGTLGGAADAAARMPGSVAVALAGLAQGVQIIRVHDVAETVQAVRLWQAATTGLRP